MPSVEEFIRELAYSPITPCLGMLTQTEIPREYSCYVCVDHGTWLSAGKDEDGISHVVRDPGDLRELRPITWHLAGIFPNDVSTDGLELVQPPIQAQRLDYIPNLCRFSSLKGFW
jgi:hypothetical protein